MGTHFSKSKLKRFKRSSKKRKSTLSDGVSYYNDSVRQAHCIPLGRKERPVERLVCEELGSAGYFSRTENAVQTDDESDYKYEDIDFPGESFTSLESNLSGESPYCDDVDGPEPRNPHMTGWGQCSYPVYGTHPDGASNELQGRPPLNKPQTYEVEHMVTVFRLQLEECIKVTEVIPNLHFIEDHERFRNKEKESGRDAMAMLLDAIITVKEPGKWKTFLDALESAGYQYIVNLLTGRTEVDHTQQKKIIHLFKPQLIRDMHTTALVDRLYTKDLISAHDMEEIECESRARGQIAAALIILDRVFRRLKDWYPRFLEALRESGHGHLADLLDIPEIKSTPETCGTTLENDVESTIPKQLASVPERNPKNNTCMISLSSKSPRRLEEDGIEDEECSDLYINACDSGDEAIFLDPPRQKLSEVKRLKRKKAELEKKLEKAIVIRDLKRDIKGLRRQLDEVEADRDSSDSDYTFGEAEDGDTNSKTRASVKTKKLPAECDSTIQHTIEDSMLATVKEEIDSQFKNLREELQSLTLSQSNVQEALVQGAIDRMMVDVKKEIELHFKNHMEELHRIVNSLIAISSCPPVPEAPIAHTWRHENSSREQYTSGYDTYEYAGGSV